MGKGRKTGARKGMAIYNEEFDDYDYGEIHIPGKARVAAGKAYAKGKPAVHEEDSTDDSSARIDVPYDFVPKPSIKDFVPDAVPEKEDRKVKFALEDSDSVAARSLKAKQMASILMDPSLAVKADSMPLELEEKAEVKAPAVHHAELPTSKLIKSIKDCTDDIKTLELMLAEKRAEQAALQKQLETRLLKMEEAAEKKKKKPVPTPGECVICLHGVPDQVLLPCGHMVLCSSCTSMLVDSGSPECPICRAAVKKHQRVFFN